MDSRSRTCTRRTSSTRERGWIDQMRYLSIAVVLVVLGAHTFGAGQSSMSYGPTTQTCGFWTTERQKQSADARLLQWWMLGYASGASAITAGLKMPIMNTD